MLHEHPPSSQCCIALGTCAMPSSSLWILRLPELLPKRDAWWCWWGRPPQRGDPRTSASVCSLLSPEHLIERDLYSIHGAWARSAATYLPFVILVFFLCPWRATVAFSSRVMLPREGCINCRQWKVYDWVLSWGVCIYTTRNALSMLKHSFKKSQLVVAVWGEICAFVCRV